MRWMQVSLTTFNFCFKKLFIVNSLTQGVSVFFNIVDNFIDWSTQLCRPMKFCDLSPGCEQTPRIVNHCDGEAPMSCPSKQHFAKCVTKTSKAVQQRWRGNTTIDCGKHVISGYFKSAYTHIHLAAEKTNGFCSILCDATDDYARGRREQFRKLIITLEKARQEKKLKQKQQAHRITMRDAWSTSRLWSTNLQETQIVSTKSPGSNQILWSFAQNTEVLWNENPFTSRSGQWSLHREKLHRRPVPWENKWWELMTWVIKTMGPLLLLSRLTDGQKPVISKLHWTQLYVRKQMEDTATRVCIYSNTSSLKEIK